MHAHAHITCTHMQLTPTLLYHSPPEVLPSSVSMSAAVRSKIITKRSGSTPSSPPCQNYYYYYYRSFQLATTTAIYFLLNLEEHFHIPDIFTFHVQGPISIQEIAHMNIRLDITEGNSIYVYTIRLWQYHLL